MDKPASNPDSDSLKAPAKLPASGGSSFRGPRWARAKLKLIGSLRGAGSLIWSGGATPAAYEIDLFANGDQRSASGNLEGAFAVLAAGDPASEDLLLKLQDGREVAIQVAEFEPDFAEFESAADFSTPAP
ncbi:MAG TPA: hypothetical protein VF459_16890 [Caulobacteraceae bacterium]